MGEKNPLMYLIFTSTKYGSQFKFFSEGQEMGLDVHENPAAKWQKETLPQGGLENLDHPFEVTVTDTTYHMIRKAT